MRLYADFPLDVTGGTATPSALENPVQHQFPILVQ